MSKQTIPRLKHIRLDVSSYKTDAQKKLKDEGLNDLALGEIENILDGMSIINIIAWCAGIKLAVGDTANIEVETRDDDYWGRETSVWLVFDRLETQKEVDHRIKIAEGVKASNKKKSAKKRLKTKLDKQVDVLREQLKVGTITGPDFFLEEHEYLHKYREALDKLDGI